MRKQIMFFVFIISTMVNALITITPYQYAQYYSLFDIPEIIETNTNIEAIQRFLVTGTVSSDYIVAGAARKLLELQTKRSEDVVFMYVKTWMSNQIINLELPEPEHDSFRSVAILNASLDPVRMEALRYFSGDCSENHISNMCRIIPEYITLFKSSSYNYFIQYEQLLLMLGMLKHYDSPIITSTFNKIAEYSDAFYFNNHALFNKLYAKIKLLDYSHANTVTNITNYITDLVNQGNNELLYSLGNVWELSRFPSNTLYQAFTVLKNYMPEKDYNETPRYSFTAIENIPDLSMKLKDKLSDELYRRDLRACYNFIQMTNENKLIIISSVTTQKLENTASELPEITSVSDSLSNRLDSVIAQNIDFFTMQSDSNITNFGSAYFFINGLGVTPFKRKLKYKGIYFFSGGTFWPEDNDFSSGFAVKEGGKSAILWSKYGCIRYSSSLY